ncbi:MAG: ParB N-terminal domain-containing protein [Verrucomicrobiota bacterium]
MNSKIPSPIPQSAIRNPHSSAPHSSAPQSAIEYRDPNDLRPHPKIKDLPRWIKDSTEFNALVEDIRDHGVQQPAVITADGLVMDGETRRLACKQLQVDIPCVVRPEADLINICIASETLRRHLTKSQLAFKYYPLIREVFIERELHDATARTVRKFVPRDFSAVRELSKQVSEFALRLGISVRLLEQAHELHQLFDAEPRLWPWTSDGAKRNLEILGRDVHYDVTFADYFGSCIMHPDIAMSLGGALEALKQKLSQLDHKHTGNKPAPKSPDDPLGDTPSKQLMLLNEAFKHCGNRWEYWHQLHPVERKTVLSSWHASFNIAPEEMKIELLSTTLDTLAIETLTTLRTKIAAELKQREK